jgi:hypothetical protein
MGLQQLGSAAGSALPLEALREDASRLSAEAFA